MIVSDEIGHKAARLVDQNRVIVWREEHGNQPESATVSGDTAQYKLQIQEDRVYCPCPAWHSDRWCSHAVAVCIYWWEATTRERSLDP